MRAILRNSPLILLLGLWSLSSCYNETPIAIQRGGDEITAGINPAVSPSGTKLAFSRDYHIFLSDFSGQIETQLTSGTAEDFLPLWSPLEDHIAFIRAIDTLIPNLGRDRYNSLMAITVGDKVIRKLSLSERQVQYGFWSSKNDRVAYLYYSYPEGSVIRIVNSNGLVLSQFSASEFSWSPDGDHFVCTSYKNESKALYVGTVGSASLLQISTRSGPYSPRWLPDGNTISFFTTADGLIFLNLQTLSETVLSKEIGQSPQVSPDGKKLAYLKYETYSNPDQPHNGFLYSLDIASGGVFTLVTTRGNYSINFTWAPSSKEIYYEFNKKIFKVHVP